MNLARRIALSFAMLGFMVAGAVAGGFQLNEHGARAMAQGDAFAARATDGSAIYFNPAGLAFQDNISLYAGATVILPTSSFYGPVQDNTNARTQAPGQFFYPINFYLTGPATDAFHVGIGVYNPYGLGSKWPNDWSGRFLTTNVQLQTYFITPTVSYKILDNLSVGAGFSYVAGSVTVDRAVAIPVQGTGSDPRVSLELTGHGYAWDIGAQYKITPKLSVGASYRSSAKIDANGSATFTPNYAVLKFPEGGVSTSITLPATAFAGVAYKVLANLEIEADYQFIGWSSYDKLEFDFNADGSKSSQPKNYSDTYMLRIGGEYTMGDLHLRGGYYYDHTPVSSQYVDPILPDANRNGITFGFGYNLTDQFSIDASYMFLKFDERQAINTDLGFDGTYHTYVNLVGLDLAYKF